VIRRITLRNWRAYDSLDLLFGPGATFVVAKNGVGKTSLVRGVAWALFGAAAVPDPKSAIRGNAESATAIVEFELPNGQVGEIQREVNVAGAVSVSASVAHIEVEDGPASLVTTAFGADESILSRLCVLQEGTVMGGQDTAAGDLSSHLARVFGVDILNHAALQVRAIERDAERAAIQVRREERTSTAAIAAMVEEAARMQTELTAFENDRDAASQKLRDAQEVVSIAREWSSHRAAEGQRRQLLLGLLNDARALGLEVEDLAILPEAVEDALRAARDRLGVLQTEEAQGASLIELRERQLRELRSSPAVCPICLRPLALDEIEAAERGHTDDIQSAKRAQQTRDAARRTQEATVELLDKLNKTIAKVPIPASPKVAEPSDAENSTAALDTEQAHLGAIILKLGAMTARLDAIKEQLAADERAAEVSRRLGGLYRRQAIASLLQRTLSGSADELLTGHIDPLARELGSRWKSLWSDRPPIHLTPQGRMVSLRAGRSVDYADFSGGERVVAELVLRLLAISMTTRADFLCLDEPLEHLDPRNRRMIASLLVNAARQSQVRQIIATTYEESLARRLSDQSAGTLVYVEGSPSD
jgi:DNA repair exonuclease SbcCD ATPase subunit